MTNRLLAEVSQKSKVTHSKIREIDEPVRSGEATPVLAVPVEEEVAWFPP